MPWRGAPTWQHACYVLRSVVLGNWPKLATVVLPAHALREGEPVKFTYHERDPAAWQDTPSEDTNDVVDDVSATVVEPCRLSMLLYPSTTPLAKTFHLYIMLLGRSWLAVEIAEVLAWLRQLELMLTTYTLAIGKKVGLSPHVLEKH